MLKEAEEVINISPAAVKAVQDIIDEKGMDGHGLRIYVSGSGCSGIQFGMALDDNIKDTDTTVETDGVKVIVDHQSLEYARGASVDFINDPQKGTGFVINVPHQAEHGGCGCGNNEEENSCGGGNGGCGC